MPEPTRNELETLARDLGLSPDEADRDGDLLDLLRDRDAIPEAAGMCC